MEYSDEEDDYQYSSDVEEEDEVHNDGEIVQSGEPAPSNFRVIEEEELMTEQKRVCEDISGVLDIPSTSSGVLLRYFSWNKEKLFDTYYADPDGTRVKSGIEFAGVEATPLPDDTEVTCQICCDDMPAKETFCMGCNHRFCLACWVPFLKNKVSDGPTCVYTTCPAHGCNEIVDESVFNRLIDAETLTKYSRFVLRSFVDINRSTKWCPFPGCTKAVAVAGYHGVVECGCGYSWCFKCTEESHLPVPCETLTKWLDKCRNESETANWILANTRQCPKCNVRIEKNQGCNHMTCRNCKYEFCWICFGEWGDHGSRTGGYYKCNRFDAEKEVPDTDAAKAKLELERYLHYYRRYANHDAAGKFAAKQRVLTERRMVQLQETSEGTNWIDVQFLRTATEQLIECRRVLKYTYVFAYYLTDQKEKDLFEYLQENLEKNTEQLAELVEMPLETMDRSAVVNFTRVTERFLKNLLEGVDEGLTTEV